LQLVSKVGNLAQKSSRKGNQNWWYRSIFKTDQSYFQVALGQFHGKKLNETCHQKTQFATDAKLAFKTADEPLCVVRKVVNNWGPQILCLLNLSKKQQNFRCLPHFPLTVSCGCL